MRRFLFLSFWSAFYMLAAAFVALSAVVGIVELRIGPVVWAVGDRHGVHAGDVVIASIAAFLVTLFTIGLGLAVREAGRDHRGPQ